MLKKIFIASEYIVKSEGARPGGVAGRDAPAPVVADPAPLARGPHLADQLGVGVVAQFGAPAHRAPHPGHAPALVVAGRRPGPTTACTA